MSSFAQNATVVLVHGAWADGSCWLRVILPLRREGLKVTCAPIPLTSLKEDIAALQCVLERASGPTVLVGHAYAGAVIAAPNDSRVRSLVYVAALAPDEDETVADGFLSCQAASRGPRPPTGCAWADLDARRRFCPRRRSQGFSRQTAILEATQRPIAVKCIRENAPVPGWKTKPSWFLLAEEDRMIAPETQHYMAERMGAKIRRHHVDHSPMHTAPEVVVDVVLD